MKKLVAVSILLVVLSVSVFAQFKVGLYADFMPELMKATAPLDDSADAKVGNTKYAGKGTFDFLSSWATYKGNELRLALSYTDPDGNYSGSVRFRGDSLINPSSAVGSTFYASGTGSGINALTFFNQTIDDYYVRGKIGKVSAEFGDIAARGKTDSYRFAGTFGAFQDALKQDNFGVLHANPTNATWTKLDVNNLQQGVSSAGLWNAGLSYIQTTVDLKPVYVTLSGGVFAIPEAAGKTASFSEGNAGIRVSGVDIADIVTFDVTYKISGADKNTETNKDRNPVGQPDGQGNWNHAFGLYAGFKLPVDGLGLSVGYSGIAKATEDNDDKKTVNPFLNGIDLRVNYTGVEKLTVTFNNNFSFAVQNGDSDNKVNVIPVFGTNTFQGYTLSRLGQDQKDSYFAMYNALGALYKITDAFTGHAELINRMSTETVEFSSSTKGEFTKDQLRIALSGIYAATSHVSFEAGLAFGIDHWTQKVTSLDDAKYGTFTFGVPLRFKVTY